MLVPFTVVWASCWAIVQYMWRKLVSEMMVSLSSISRLRSTPRLGSEVRYGRGAGSWAGDGTRCPASASSCTIHGDIDVAKDLLRNGPSGRYSQAWMSRADQSLTRHSPKMEFSAAAAVIGLPCTLPPRLQSRSPTRNRAECSVRMQRRHRAGAVGPGVGGWEYRRRRPTKRDRGSRSEGAANSEAATAHPGETVCRRWWRAPPTSRSRHSPRRRLATAGRPRPCARRSRRV